MDRRGLACIFSLSSLFCTVRDCTCPCSVASSSSAEGLSVFLESSSSAPAGHRDSGAMPAHAPAPRRRVPSPRGLPSPTGALGGGQGPTWELKRVSLLILQCLDVIARVLLLVLGVQSGGQPPRTPVPGAASCYPHLPPVRTSGSAEPPPPCPAAPSHHPALPAAPPAPGSVGQNMGTGSPSLPSESRWHPGRQDPSES